MTPTLDAPSPSLTDLHPRDRLLKGAARLFAARGYHAVGMTELGEAVGLSRGAIYHHIESKQDMLDEICSRYMSELGAAALEVVRDEPAPLARLKRLGEQLVRAIFDNQAELTVCFREIQSLEEPRRAHVLALHAAYEKVWKSVLIEGADAGVFKPYSAIRLKALLGMFYYSYIWMQQGKPETIPSITAMFNEIVADTVCVRA